MEHPERMQHASMVPMEILVKEDQLDQQVRLALKVSYCSLNNFDFDFILIIMTFDI